MSNMSSINEIKQILDGLSGEMQTMIANLDSFENEFNALGQSVADAVEGSSQNIDTEIQEMVAGSSQAVRSVIDCLVEVQRVGNEYGGAL